MITENRDLTRMARESLRGNWGLAAVGSFLYLLIVMTINVGSRIGIEFFDLFGVVGLFNGFVVVFLLGLISVLIGPVMALGYTIFTLHIARDEEANISHIFEGFHHFLKALLITLLTGLFTFLWALLLIIPGMIASLRYVMAYYLLIDDPSLGPLEAIRKSKALMKGYKWKYFCLNLRFIGWVFLSFLTLGIGLFWLAPYMQVSLGKFYDDVKNNGNMDDQEDYA